ncbi:MAG: thioredoxin fold domain-containing protein [Armatimonadia bacterium]|nr:thioredoxin fold domain-containing protein [Armatimonadia bacterium]
MSDPTVGRDSLRQRLAVGTGVTLVHFTAPWCPPCRMQSAEAARLSDASGGEIGFIEVDVAEDPAAAEDYRVGAVPTLVFFQGEAELCRATGFRTRGELRGMLDRARTEHQS